MKEVNDQWGHSAGDRLICRAAEQLRAVFPGRVYRTGGDEFVVVDRQCGEEEFYAAIRALERELTAHEVSCSAASRNSTTRPTTGCTRKNAAFTARASTIAGAKRTDCLGRQG